MKSRCGGEEGAEVSTGVLALGKLDQDEQQVVAGQPGGRNDAEDAQGEEGTEFIHTDAAMAAESVQCPRKGGVTAGAGVPGVPNVDAPCGGVQFQVVDVGAGAGGQGQPEGTRVHVGLVPGNEPAAQGHEVPEQVRGFARDGVATGELEVEPAQRVGDVGFGGVPCVSPVGQSRSGFKVWRTLSMVAATFSVSGRPLAVTV